MPDSDQDSLRELRNTDLNLSEAKGQNAALISQLFDRGGELKREFGEHVNRSTEREIAQERQIAGVLSRVQSLETTILQLSADLRAEREARQKLERLLDAERTARQEDKNQLKARAGTTSAGIGSAMALAQLLWNYFSK